MSEEIIRIANCSGYYGDKLSAAKEMVDGGPIDVLNGDYLAEHKGRLAWHTFILASISNKVCGATA